ncbi:hypothetical protein M8C21_031132 [Ambrosia artemisiifolia]|uniref:Transcription factor MYB1R1-like protein n=1 Tax=Ambrosia artemisiifolia TaxID=4212 RepID=A0AAD5D0U5_AMBAR|nr:hypothetical protein M8C21_031132 [Ambrosia artemisiifolia]
MSQSQSDDSSSNEIMLFGVRVKVDPMRKSVSMNNLSQYQHLPNPLQSSNINNNINNNNNLDLSAVAADGYASADDVVVRTQSNGSRERKRGIPWTEDEHKLFLLGLQKVGKGDWRGISRNFVKTRTPTQVASHAQKYFLRRSNLNRRRRRSSLFDITTDSVAAMPTEEQQVKEDKVQVAAQPSMATSPQITPINGGSNPLLNPISIFPTPNPSTRMDLNINQEYKTAPVSLNLSLAFDPDRSSSYQVIPGFKNGDSMISVN